MNWKIISNEARIVKEWAKHLLPQLNCLVIANPNFCSYFSLPFYSLHLQVSPSISRDWPELSQLRGKRNQFSLEQTKPFQRNSHLICLSLILTKTKTIVIIIRIIFTWKKRLAIVDCSGLGVTSLMVWPLRSNNWWQIGFVSTHQQIKTTK